MNISRKERIKALLAFVKFEDPMPYTFHVSAGPTHPDMSGPVVHYLQASYPEEDTFTKVPATQWTRKWHIADDATDSQIVQTAFKLCLTSAEHRTREGFQYKGVRIYGPHFDVEDLVKLGEGKGQWGGAPKKDFKW